MHSTMPRVLNITCFSASLLMFITRCSRRCRSERRGACAKCCFHISGVSSPRGLHVFCGITPMAFALALDLDAFEQKLQILAVHLAVR